MSCCKAHPVTPAYILFVGRDLDTKHALFVVLTGLETIVAYSVDLGDTKKVAVSLPTFCMSHFCLPNHR